MRGTPQQSVVRSVVICAEHLYFHSPWTRSYVERDLWIEHWPKESTEGGTETFELVVFSSYEVTERAPYLGETRAWIGDATWKLLDRATVEILVGGKV
jgi:hypothetical protein